MSFPIPISNTIYSTSRLPIYPILFHQFKSCRYRSRTISFEKYRVFRHTNIMKTEFFRVSSSSDSESGVGFGVGGSGVGSFSIEESETDVILGNGVLQQGDVTNGIQATINKMSKWLVTVLFGIVILWRHDAEALWALLGSVINALLSVVLKKVLNQERPTLTMRGDPGMPSSHAQIIFFGVSFVIISLVKLMGFNKVTVTISVLTLALGTYLSWLRISQGLHTLSQVLVGSVLGSLFALAWFQLWDRVMVEAFVSSLAVRIIVASGAAVFCVGFLIYVIQHWFKFEF